MSEKKIAILKCRDCGHELNRSIPFEEKDASKVRVTSGFAGGKCPNGCRSTFSDLNLNTEVEIQDYIEDSPQTPDTTKQSQEE